jgi:hypothetical protein
MGVSVFSLDGFYNRKWAEGCLRFNQSVLEYLSNATSVEVVVLSSFLGQYLAGNRLIATVSRGVPAFLTERDGGEDIAVESLRATVAAVRALGKRVVLVAPPPMSDFDVGRCLELTANGKAVFGADNTSCAISEARYRSLRAGVFALLEHVGGEADIPVFRLDDFLCRAGICAVELKGSFLYRDAGHLSYDGSRLLGQQMGLANRLIAIAR